MTDDAQLQRDKLYTLLGDLPSRDRKITGRLLDEQEREFYILQKLVLDLNGIELVPAYFLKPKKGEGCLPTILFNHSHGGRYELGKDELLYGSVYYQSPPYAEVLTSLGCAVLCIDAWLFGERRGKKENELFKEMLWKGQVLWGIMVYDALRAFDYLASRDDIDPQRIGTMGLSMGSTLSWWLAALEPRISICIDLCCLTDFQALLDSGGLDLHGLYYYVPGLLKHFRTAQINALIAPRPHLSLAGNHDPLTPKEGLDRIDAELKQIYGAMGARDAWQLVRSNSGHRETAEMRSAIISFLKKWLLYGT